MKTVPIIVGLTGGIGTGKSYVAGFFKQLGVPVYDADKEAKALLNRSEPLKEAIIAAFGEESYHNNLYNRDHIAAQISASAKAITVLNSIVHPAVAEDFNQWVSSQVSPYIIKEAALLYETGSFKELQLTIVVDAPMSVRLERIRKRDPFRSEEETRALISKQMPQEEKVALADIVINNDGSEQVEPQVIRIHHQILSGNTPLRSISE